MEIDIPRRYCQLSTCKKLIGGMRKTNSQVKYCCPQHQQAAKREREKLKFDGRRAAKAIAEGRLTADSSAGKGREGEDLQKLEANPSVLKGLQDGTLLHPVAATALGMSGAQLSRSLLALEVRTQRALVEAKFEMDDWTKRLVPRGTLALARFLARDAGGIETGAFRALVDQLAEAFISFQDEFFEIAPGKGFIVKGFHRRWIRSIVWAWLTGDKQMILSPPRHGKSELLIRFCVWFICMDFAVRIMWMSSNKDVATLMIGAVKDHLENNERLRNAVLPPGQFFKPHRTSGRPWHSTEIKIAQMNIIGQKSSTLLVLGLRSDVLSRDVDVLITDDIEDYDSTREPSGRLYGRNKFGEVGTRKEERTAWINIGSRQHPEDLANTLMGSSSLQGWNFIVETAHQDCQLDPDTIEGHDENGCVLFPEVRSYRWLMEKKAEMEDLGLPGAYDMRYLNAPRPSSGLIFRIDVIKDLCLDRSRDLGIRGIPPGSMIAGLDPAARGTQAGFCWLWTPEMLYMVDLETQEAGGFEGALRLMRSWYDQYELMDWKYEDNSQQIEFFKDPRLTALRNETGINVRPYHTGKNKQDPELGLSAMAPLYHKGKVNLPYGTAAARIKVNMFLRQLEMWTTEGKRIRSKTDIKMSSWFPFPTILRWNAASFEVESVPAPESSYPGLHSMTAPGWVTNYPHQGGFNG